MRVGHCITFTYEIFVTCGSGNGIESLTGWANVIYR